MFIGRFGGRKCFIKTMENFFFYLGVGASFGIVYASFFEWLLHRFLMHRPFAGIDYAFRSHALIHHTTFKADHTYHLVHEKDKHLIPMAWWNAPVLIALCSIPFLIVSAFTGQWGLLVGSILAFCAYYAAYEYMHWCMHLPKARRIEKLGVFYRLNGHHLLHHRYMHKNFNVVLPLADLCLGTLLLRSKVCFAQARCEALPDMQPRLTGLQTR